MGKQPWGTIKDTLPEGDQNWGIKTQPYTKFFTDYNNLNSETYKSIYKAIFFFVSSLKHF